MAQAKSMSIDLKVHLEGMPVGVEDFTMDDVDNNYVRFPDEIPTHRFEYGRQYRMVIIDIGPIEGYEE